MGRGLGRNNVSLFSQWRVGGCVGGCLYLLSSLPPLVGRCRRQRGRCGSRPLIFAYSTAVILLLVGVSATAGVPFGGSRRVALPAYPTIGGGRSGGSGSDSSVVASVAPNIHASSRVPIPPPPHPPFPSLSASPWMNAGCSSPPPVVHSSHSTRIPSFFCLQECACAPAGPSPRAPAVKAPPALYQGRADVRSRRRSPIRKEGEAEGVMVLTVMAGAAVNAAGSIGMDCGGGAFVKAAE